MTLRPALALHEGFNDVDFRVPLQDSREVGTRRGIEALCLGTRRRDRSSVIGDLERNRSSAPGDPGRSNRSSAPAFQGVAALLLRSRNRLSRAKNREIPLWLGLKPWTLCHFTHVLFVRKVCEETCRSFWWCAGLQGARVAPGSHWWPWSSLTRRAIGGVSQPEALEITQSSHPCPSSQPPGTGWRHPEYRPQSGDRTIAFDPRQHEARPPFFSWWLSQSGNKLKANKAYKNFSSFSDSWIHHKLIKLCVTKKRDKISSYQS